MTFFIILTTYFFVGCVLAKLLSFVITQEKFGDNREVILMLTILIWPAIFIAAFIASICWLFCKLLKLNLDI